jgi:hypothetical protein
MPRGHEFDQSFDRFVMGTSELWDIVLDAFQHGDML